MDAPRVTRADIEAYLELEDKRKSLERDARALAKQADEIGQKLRAFVSAVGGKAKSVVRSGYVLALTSAKGSVAWKNEFVRIAGLDAAEQLIAAAPPREHLTVNIV